MVGATLYGVQQKLKNDLRNWKDDYDIEILDYCLGRTVIICPRCSNAYAVKDLDEQLNTDWRCSQCNTRWEETPTHDITKG